MSLLPLHKKPFRVQIVCDTGLEYFRNVILGVRQYGFQTGEMIIGDRWLSYAERNLPRLVREDAIDGIIAQVHDRRFEQRLMHLGIPCVNISNAILRPRLPLVTQDDAAVGRAAAAHLIDRGCGAFAFWGQSDTAYSRQRLEGFHAALRACVGKAPFFKMESAPPESVGSPRLIRAMAAWLRTLPRPVGVFTVLDSYGLHLLRAARQLGISVPEELAILGAGDDAFWVECESIPLSSVQLPSRKIGFEAARLLVDMLKKHEREGASPVCVRLPIGEISARPSTDVLFTRDPAVQRAVAFIRAQGGRRVCVAEAVRASGVSRSALQARFRSVLGHTVLDEIHRARLIRVQKLLRTGEQKLTEIAQLCDFPDSASLCVFFRKETGQNPRRYRAQFRGMTPIGI